MAVRMHWRICNDAWLDNGLEFFGQLAEHIATQYPQVVQVRWQPDGLELTIHDPVSFVDLLDDEIRQRIESTLHYRTGKGNITLKPFVGFNQQPPSQHPLIFQDSRRREFLKRVFIVTKQSRAKRSGCPLCGEIITGSEQKLILSVYPFVTKIKSLSGIRTRWKERGLTGFVEYARICSRCYFLGALTWLDDALLYLCDIGGINGKAVILVPAPPTSNLLRLRELKSYRPKYGERRTNVRFKRFRSGEEQEVNEGQYSLLLAFLERTLYELANTSEVPDLFAEVQRHISDGWLLINIPQGRMKNIVAHDLILDESTVRLLIHLVEQGILPYAHLIAEMRLSDDRSKPLWDETSALHEELSQAILTDNFEQFASAFIPKPRRMLGLQPIQGIRLADLWQGFEQGMGTLVYLWRRSKMDAKTLEIVKKAGRAVAAIAASRKQPVLLYALERVRSPSDLLEVLKEGVHRLIGLTVEEMRYISLDALEQLTEILQQTADARQFTDLKNALIIFAGIAYAKGVMIQSAQQQGVNNDGFEGHSISMAE